MDPTAQLVADYLDRRASHPGVGADADPLFNGPQQARLTRWGITEVLTRHVQSLRSRNPGYAAGLHVTPHVIRRTRAMHLLQAGVNLIYIRDLLGHADVSTTEIYARADTQAKRNAIENAYPSPTPVPPARLDRRPRRSRMARRRLRKHPGIMWTEPAPAAPSPAQTPQPVT